MAEWREIEVRGYPIRVSEDGDIHIPEKTTTYSFVRLGRPSTKTAVFKERMLRQSINHLGYREVSFSHKRKVFRHPVHRLVAMAFVPGFRSELVVNHKDGNKLNNSPSNLEWVTKGRNSQHAWENGLIPLIGEGQPTSKLTEKQVRYIRRLLSHGVSANSLAIVAGVSMRLICLIRDGKRWKHLK
ncbi:HNH endonuclease [Phyllobacterium phragmitis]|nr:HNH endonuclease [Phyllobacterium phragmitis]